MANAVKDLPTFDEQLAVFVNQVRDDAAEVKKNSSIVCDDLTAALDSLSPGHKVHLHSEVATGLLIHDNHIEMYLEEPEENLKPQAIKYALVQSGKFYVILNAHCPEWTITFRHVETKIKCRLTNGNILALRKSELLQYYLSLDEKIYSLVLFIAFWTMCYKIARFSPQAVYMLVIFYLQQEPYKLPSVVELQRDVDPEMERGWNCAFAPQEYTNDELENATIDDLVFGFFKFYENFDYFDYVVSPYLGYAVKKTCFMEPFDLPEDYNKRGLMLPVKRTWCMQDPFEHTKNLASPLLTPESCRRFLALCSTSLEFFSQGENQLLHRLVLGAQRLPLNSGSFYIYKDSEEDFAEWRRFVKRVILATLCEVLACTFTEGPSADPLKFKVKSKCPVLENRMVASKKVGDFPSDMGELEKEIHLTSHIVKEFSAKKYCMQSVVDVVFVPDPWRVKIVISCKQRGTIHIDQFLKIKLGRFLEEREKTEEFLGRRFSRDAVDGKFFALGIVEKSFFLFRKKIL